jgi:hypothetical protein
LLANFQSEMSDDFFSIQVQDDSVSWGLFVEGPVEGRPDALGKKWSNKPGGTVTTNCSYARDAVGMNDASTFVLCVAEWEGQATENFTLEVVENAQVEVACLYSRKSLCDFICDDDNDCTADACIDGEGCVYENLREGRFCRFQGEAPGICIAGGECVRNERVAPSVGAFEVQRKK